MRTDRRAYMTAQMAALLPDLPWTFFDAHTRADSAAYRLSFPGESATTEPMQYNLRSHASVLHAFAGAAAPGDALLIIEDDAAFALDIADRLLSLAARAVSGEYDYVSIGTMPYLAYRSADAPPPRRRADGLLAFDRVHATEGDAADVWGLQAYIVSGAAAAAMARVLHRNTTADVLASLRVAMAARGIDARVELKLHLDCILGRLFRQAFTDPTLAVEMESAASSIHPGNNERVWRAAAGRYFQPGSYWGAPWREQERAAA